MKSTPDIQKKSNQIVGNAGIFYCCYRLSLMGWNVLPTSRNVKGIDIVAYKDEMFTKFVTIQVKSLSKKNPVGIGGQTDTLMGEFWVIINNLNLQKNPPNAYILTLDEIKIFTEKSKMMLGNYPIGFNRNIIVLRNISNNGIEYEFSFSSRFFQIPQKSRNESIDHRHIAHGICNGSPIGF